MSTTPHQDPLHFPRADLARMCFLLWTDMGASWLSIYAQRRMGKTTFLQTDLTKEGEENGYRMEYFTFMGKRDPQRALVEWLVELQHGGTINRSAAGTKVTGEVALPGGMGKLSAETVLSDPADAGLDKIMRSLARQEKQLVLMLDEFQELADDPANKGFIAALRSAMDSNRSILAIFTGSSMEKLQRVFEDVHAPFYNSASTLPFPPLGQDFTNFLADHFDRKRPCGVFTRENVLIAHARLGGVTKDTRDFLNTLLISPEIGDFDARLDAFVAKVTKEFGPVVELANAEDIPEVEELKEEPESCSMSM